MNTLEKEIDILETLAQGPRPVNQRNLARIIGLSLGMTNSILKRLVQKGWLKIQKVNNRNIQYIISPRGMEKILKRSYLYLRRTIKNVVYYKEAIEDLAHELSQKGYKAVMLIGASDLDFIVEHACGLTRLRFIRAASVEEAQRFQRENSNGFLLFAESFSGTDRREQAADRAFLSKILLKAQGDRAVGAPA